MPGLRVIRALRPPFVHRVKIGPSAAKFPLDALLTLTAFRVGLTGKCDVIHSHEEGGVIGVVLSCCCAFRTSTTCIRACRSSSPTSRLRGSSVARGIVRWFEKLINQSKVVIVICPALEDTVRATAPDANVVLIENTPGSAEERAATRNRRRPSARHVSAETPLVLYGDL